MATSGGGQQGKSGGGKEKKSKNGKQQQQQKQQKTALTFTCSCGIANCTKVNEYSVNQIRLMTWDELMKFNELQNTPNNHFNKELQTWVATEIIRRDCERKAGATGHFHEPSANPLKSLPKASLRQNLQKNQNVSLNTSKSIPSSSISSRRKSNERLLEEEPPVKTPRQNSQPSFKSPGSILIKSIDTEDDYQPPKTPGAATAELLSSTLSIGTGSVRNDDGASNVVRSIYFETQQELLCGQHAVNMLLQSPIFNAEHLQIAGEAVHNREAEARGVHPHLLENQQISDSGNVSLPLLEELLRDRHIVIENFAHPQFNDIRNNPQIVEAYIIHQGNHWFTLRRFDNTWILLNSMNAGPAIVENLSHYFEYLQQQGSLIYVVVGQLDAVEIAEEDLQYPVLQLPLRMATITETPKRQPRRTVSRKSASVTSKPSSSRRTSRSTSRSGKEKGVNDVTNDSNFEEELEAHRDGTNEEKPKFTTPALVKYFFVQAGVAVAKKAEIVNWFMEFTYYNKEGIEKARDHVNKGFRNVETFARVSGSKDAEWRYKQSPVVEVIEEAVDRIENREFEEGLHEVEWIKQGSTFKCCGYKFSVDRKHRPNGNTDLYGRCVDCSILRNRLDCRNWMVNGATISKEEGTVCRLKFLNGLDKPVSGCPWMPGGVAHFCLKQHFYDGLIRQDIIKERMEKSEELIKEAIKFLEDKYDTAADDFDVEALDEDLKKFIKRQTLVFEYYEGTKLCFLYFIVKNGVLKYIGISTDFERRDYEHPHEAHKDLYEGDDEVETFVAPLGRRNEMFMKDLEAACIRLSKAGELGGDGICKVDVVNRDDGHFESKDHVLKKVVEDPEDEDHAGLVAALNQLLQISLKKDNLIISSVGTSTADYIKHGIYLQQNRTSRLQHLQPAPPPQSQTLSTQSTVGSSSQSQQKIPEKYTALKALVESQTTQHPYYLDQIPWSLYILIKGKKVRYGITSNLTQRKNRHISSNTLDGDFKMLVVPFGDENLLFIMDFEASCIRLSKNKKLKDGHENMNSNFDNGRFSSKYEILEAKVEKEDAQLIEALNQLIKWTLNSDIKVE